MPHYLIEFRFHGYAKRYLKRLIFEVARRFHVKGVTRKRPVPHITLAGPFETRDIKRVIRDVESVAKNYNLVNFKLRGFGYFNNLEGKVIYVDIEPSKELEELRWELAKRLMMYVELKEGDKNKKFAFHATIAFKDIDRKFSDIWRYLKSKEIPYINQYLLRITILRNGKILHDFDLMLKRLLNRRAALSNRIWKKTILRFKMKLFFRKALAKVKRIFWWS
ncbi:MAG TPA: 2'-5' RNA ligase family protein [Candidatus Bathyarchaeia archaeon]|nr:2'-5' RNA ligase family protein [Candidatus Bathyarchaeia archaeon]